MAETPHGNGMLKRHLPSDLLKTYVREFHNKSTYLGSLHTHGDKDICTFYSSSVCSHEREWGVSHSLPPLAATTSLSCLQGKDAGRFCLFASCSPVLRPTQRQVPPVPESLMGNTHRGKCKSTRLLANAFSPAERGASEAMGRGEHRRACSAFSPGFAIYVLNKDVHRRQPLA